MFDFSADGAFEQVARLTRVVEVVEQGICDRVRHNDFRREMRYRFNAIFSYDAVQEGRISGIANDERRGRPYGPVKSRGEIVKHHDFCSRIEEREHHMPADISGPSSYKNGHAVGPKFGADVRLKRLDGN